MLVLTRKASQSVVIGEDIEVVVLSVKGTRVQLGFRAPDGVSIHREEAHQRILAEQAQSAIATGSAAVG